VQATVIRNTQKHFRMRAHATLQNKSLNFNCTSVNKYKVKKLAYNLNVIDIIYLISYYQCWWS